MNIVVNGEVHDTPATTLAELCLQEGYGGDRIATAVNGDFVPATARAQTQLAENDNVEIVAPRQGG